MIILDENGEDINQYPGHKRNLPWTMAGVFQPYLPDKTALLIAPWLDRDTITLAIKNYSPDFILIETASHACNQTVISEQFSVPVYYLSSNMDYFYDVVPYHLFFPFWLFASRTFPENSVEFGSTADIHRTHAVACPNRNLKHRPHRIYSLSKLLQQQFIDKIHYTIYRYDDFDFNFADYGAAVGLTNAEWLHIKNIYDHAPYFSEGEQGAVTDTNYDIFTDSHVNFLIETYIEYKFMSEKSYKPILAGQIPVIYGPLGVNKMMSDLGFDMFYDIIDHTCYDDIADWRERVNTTIACLGKIVDYDFAKIFAATAERRQCNKEYIFSNRLTDLVMQPIIDRIKRQAA